MGRFKSQTGEGREGGDGWDGKEREEMGSERREKKGRGGEAREEQAWGGAFVVNRSKRGHGHQIWHMWSHICFRLS